MFKSLFSKKAKSKTRKYDQQYKIIAGLIALISLLSFMAIISYTRADHSNAQIAFTDLFKVFTSDPFIEAKAETSQNWLGLLGAYLADKLINNTVGWLVIFLPILAALWSYVLFMRKSPDKRLVRYTSVYFLFCLTFTAFLGTIGLIDWLPDMPREMTGTVGIFLSDSLSKVLGRAGAFIVTLVASASVIIIGFGISLKPVIDYIMKYKGTSLTIKKSTDELINTKPKSGTLREGSPLSTDVPDNLQEKTAVTDENDNNDLAQKFSSPIRKIGLGGLNLTINTPQTKAEDMAKQNNVNPKEKTPKDVNIDLPVSDKSTKADDTVYSSSDANKPSPPQEIDLIKGFSIDSNDDKNEEVFTGIASDIDNSDETPNQMSSEDAAESHPSFDNISDHSNEPQSEINIENHSTTDSKRLNITVNKITDDDDDGADSPISTQIHDKSINYTMPSADLLENTTEPITVSEEELTSNGRILQEKLETFKIFIENLSVTPGPVVTQYEFVPAAGIKISKIESLADDLEMALKARGIRIIAPIPGKGTVGIEIPNSKSSMVSFAESAASGKFRNCEFELPLALGKTISGEIFLADLTKMPHLLIAGSTGSGKSVGINSMIASLLYKKMPHQLKFVLIDPKKVELPQYAALRSHYLASSPDVKDRIITKPEEAVAILKSVVIEMEQRYDILADVGQRNIADYNSKVKSGKFKDTSKMVHREMPYIVVVIDELADLMLTASKEIEEPITRLAQMARAVGIHLIIATQRPSVDVITGLIKANFPARIAYYVASKIDSRTILDMQGAEQLLGRGDMLFMASGEPKPVRIQNGYISTDEVESICTFISEQEGYPAPYMLPSSLDKSEAAGGISKDDRDPLFEDAARMFIQQQQASVSLLQRRLKVGYARAGRIVDELEDAGVVGPFTGSKARDVLMDSPSELERIL